MKQRKKVSVVIPAYNIESYIGACMDSLLRQTYHALELLAVDDGSTDRTGAILDSYAAKDSRVHVIHQENGGVSAARRRGLAVASGAYISFCDGDDTMESDMLELLVHNLEQQQVDISHCGYEMNFPSHTDFYYNTGEKRYMNREQGLEALLRGDQIEPALYNKLYRKKLFRGLSLADNVRYDEDLLWNFYLFSAAESSFFEDVCKYHYRIREGSACTSGISARSVEDPLRVSAEIMEHVSNRPGLYAICYQRYIRQLLYPCTHSMGCSEACQEQLREEMRTGRLRQYAPLRLRGMAFGVRYLPRTYRLVRRVYDRVSGNVHKYDPN